MFVARTAGSFRIKELPELGPFLVCIFIVCTSPLHPRPARTRTYTHTLECKLLRLLPKIPPVGWGGAQCTPVHCLTQSRPPHGASTRDWGGRKEMGRESPATQVPPPCIPLEGQPPVPSFLSLPVSSPWASHRPPSCTCPGTHRSLPSHPTLPPVLAHIPSTLFPGHPSTWMPHGHLGPSWMTRNSHLPRHVTTAPPM